MTVWRKAAAWVALLVMGVVLAGLGVYFARIGVDRAAKVSGVLGGLSGLAGLGLAAYGLVRARSGASPTSPPPAVGDGSQVVSGSSIMGDNIQIGGAGGDVDIRRG